LRWGTNWDMVNCAAFLVEADALYFSLVLWRRVPSFRAILGRSGTSAEHFLSVLPSYRQLLHCALGSLESRVYLRLTEKPQYRVQWEVLTAYSFLNIQILSSRPEVLIVSHCHSYDSILCLPTKPRTVSELGCLCDLESSSPSGMVVKPRGSDSRTLQDGAQYF